MNDNRKFESEILMRFWWNEKINYGFWEEFFKK
jgi:hypothetical protein